MKLTVTLAAFTLLWSLGVVRAQTSLILPPNLSIPLTVPLTDNKDGKQIGTATFSDNHIYLRHSNGEFMATVEIARDGTRTLYDPHGKIIDQLPGVKLPE